MPTLAQTETIYSRARRLSAKYPDPKDIATAVIKEIQDDPQLVLATLQAVLPGFCRSIISARRRFDVPQPPAPRDDDEIIIRVASPAPGQPKTSSKKNQRLREWRDAVFGQSYHVGPETYRTLGELTYADVQYAIAERRDLADRNNGEADRLERLAAAMQCHKVEHVNELPVALVADIMRHAS